jgi:hypothetical protein
VHVDHFLNYLWYEFAVVAGIKWRALFKNKEKTAGLVVVTLKVTVFWDVTPLDGGYATAHGRRR